MLSVSPWVARCAAMIPSGGQVLDLACGSGRHAIHLAGMGYAVTAVDIDLTASAMHHENPGVVWRQADLEAGAWPFEGQTFQGVVVTNYLFRPLFDRLIASIAPGGVLIYETFAAGQAKYGRPRNPDHLLNPGELLEWVQGQLRVLAYEDLDESEQRRCVQRLCARRV